MRSLGRLVVGMTVLGTAGLWGWAAEPTTRPSQRVLRILDRLESEGNKIKDLTAKVRYETNDTVAGARQAFWGVIDFLRIGPNDCRFRVEFTKRKVLPRGRPIRKKQLWIFDGQFLIEAKEASKMCIRREICRPGEPVDLLEVGKGPFPVPFGQKKDEVLKYYRVRLIEPAAKKEADDAPRDILELVPRKGTRRARDHKKIVLHVDRKLGLPTRIVDYEKKSETILTADFSDIRINKGVSKSHFSFKTPRDWEEQIEPLRAGSK